MIIGHHIFISSFGDDVAVDFAEKISDFHSIYINELLLHEVGLNSDLNKNANFDAGFYSLLIKYLKKSSPFIKVDHVSDLALDVSCSIYYLSEHKDIEGFYMTQVVEDWDGTTDSCHQVWSINENSNLLSLNNHWLLEVF